MIGQSFAPFGDPTQQRPQSGGGSEGPQQAIKVLNLRMPRVAGVGAPAPQALLDSAGSGGLPQGQLSPVLQQILQAVLGHFAPQAQAAPSAMGGLTQGQTGGGPMTPAVHYQPPPLTGGTAGPNPMDRRNVPTPPARLNGFSYQR